MNVWVVKKIHNYLYGQNFIIVTDHQPLTSIFHPKKSIPIMTAARLQRYAIILSAHNYLIEYRKTKLHSNADGLSRLPLNESKTFDKGMDYANIFYTRQLNSLRGYKKRNTQRQHFIQSSNGS